MGPIRIAIEFRAALAAVLCSIAPTTASTQEAIDPTPLSASDGSGSALDAYLNAFAQLDGHEIAALALTLGILCSRW